jgi:hypothetical protein
MRGRVIAEKSRLVRAASCSCCAFCPYLIGLAVVIHYRWHPLYGQRVRRIQGEQRASGEFVHVELMPGVVTIVPATAVLKGLGESKRSEVQKLYVARKSAFNSVAPDGHRDQRDHTVGGEVNGVDLFQWFLNVLTVSKLNSPQARRQQC